MMWVIEDVLKEKSTPQVIKTKTKQEGKDGGNVCEHLRYIGYFIQKTANYI